MLHRFVGGDLLPLPEARAAAVAVPRHRPLPSGLAPIPPTTSRPPSRLVVTARVRELRPLTVGHRHPPNPEPRHVHHVSGLLVVQRDRHGQRAHPEHELATLDQHAITRDGSTGRQRRPGPQHRSARPQLQGCQHRLVVLLLVLDHHRVREEVLGAFERLEHPAADLPPVPARLDRRQKRERRPGGPRVLKSVVKPVDVPRQQAWALQDAAPQQPQLLLLRHMCQVPHQRAHDRTVHCTQLGILEVGQPRGPAARPLEVRGNGVRSQPSSRKNTFRHGPAPPKP